MSDFLELDTKALLAVNGGASCSGGSCSSYGGSNVGNSNGGGGNYTPPKETTPSYNIVGNSYAEVANAKPGDKMKKGDAYVTLTQGDIDWAKAQLEKNATNSGSTNINTIVNTGIGSCGGTCGGGTVGNDGNGDTSAWNGISPQLVIPTYTQQRDFSKKYGTSFGENACAATSLLNEISEEYTRQTGKALSQEEIKRAMEAAIKSGGISKNNAYINNWVSAANAMADAVGLKGDYSYTTNSSQANATIYAWDNDGDGWADHFVNDIGNGRYYDPWTGTIGNVSELTLATQGDLGGSRDLLYK